MVSLFLSLTLAPFPLLFPTVHYFYLMFQLFLVLPKSLFPSVNLQKIIIVGSSFFILVLQYRIGSQEQCWESEDVRMAYTCLNNIIMPLLPQFLTINCVSAHLWHARLGYPSFHTIDSLTKSGFISCSNKLIGLDSSLCVGCNLSKSHRLPFSINNICCDLPFDRLHCDLQGPSPVCSTTGFRYYAVFIDDCTRFSWFFPLKHKSDFFKYICQLSTVY